MIFGTPRVSSVFLSVTLRLERGFSPFSEGALFKWCRNLVSWPFLRCFYAILALLPRHSYNASTPFLQCFYGILTILLRPFLQRPQFYSSLAHSIFIQKQKCQKRSVFMEEIRISAPRQHQILGGVRHQKDAKRVKQTGSVTPSNLLSYWFSATYKTTDYRITGLHPKLCTLPPKSSIISFFMIIYKYLYI